MLEALKAGLLTLFSPLFQPCRWPKGPEDWKCLLAKAAPWLAAAAIVAVSARSYASRVGGHCCRQAVLLLTQLQIHSPRMSGLSFA